MNQMIDAWKEIPDLSDEVSQSAESQASSKGICFNYVLSCVFDLIILLLI